MLLTPLSNKTNYSLGTCSFAQRGQLCTHPIAQKLFAIMAEKQTNLAVAADVRTKKELLDLAKTVGPEICLLKTHIDIIDDFDQELIEQLKAYAQEYNFLICEDRKFADIGSTVKAQCAGGIYKIASWADIIIAHAVAGPYIITALQEASDNRCGILLIAELSCKNNLIDQTYTNQVIKWAQGYDAVIGIIGQQAILDDPSLVKCTPGVNLGTTGDNLGQQYRTPELVITQCMTDIIIVGRGVYQADDQKKAAQAYRNAAWTAYQKRLKLH